MKPVKTIRRETGLIEGICEHNIGHPLYGSIDWMSRVTDDEPWVWEVHGCCGICCSDDEWKITTLQDSVTIANGIILDQLNYIKELHARISELEKDTV